MLISESDNESIFPREESPNPIFDFYEIQEPKSMNYENEGMPQNSEIENNNEYISKDKTTSITKQINNNNNNNNDNNNLGNKRKRDNQEDEKINDPKEIKNNPNEFEEKKNEDLNEEETMNNIFKKKKNEEPNISTQEFENTYKNTIEKKKFKVTFNCKKPDSNSQNNNQKFRFDANAKKVKKLFIHYNLKKANEILEKEGISKKFRIPSHDFTKNVTSKFNKCFATIDLKSLFCSTFKNKSPIGDILKKKIEDNKSIFQNYSFLEKKYSKFFCSPLEKHFIYYLTHDEIEEDVRNYNAKWKKNPILLNRIILMNYLLGKK